MYLLQSLSSITIWIIAFIVAASLLAFQRPALAEDWILEPYRLRNGGKYYTLLTSGFIHGDIGHLVFNMIALYFFGTALENFYELALDVSGVWVAVLFVTGVIVSSIPSLVKHRLDRGYRTLGASGGVESIVFATILLQPTADICLIYLPVCLPGFAVGVIYLGYSYWSSLNRRDFVNHDAHIAGALWGIVWQSVMTPDVWVRIVQLMGL